MSSNPYSDNNQPSPYAFQTQTPGSYSSGDGYVKQIPVLGILHIVQAALELPMFLIMIAMSGIMIAAQNSPQMQQQMQQQPSGISLQILGIGYGVFGGVIALIAIMRLTAGVLLLMRRGRIFGIVMSIVGLVSVFTCYCGPTSLALSIYSLVVLIQPSVIESLKPKV
jgi:hypothetical protein